MINSNISSDTYQFFSLLAKGLYADSPYVHRALGALISHSDESLIEERSYLLETYLTEWEISGQTTPPPEEAVISFAVGNDLKEMGENAFIENFGENAYKASKDCFIEFNNTDPEELKLYFDNKPDYIKNISMIIITETLIDIMTNVKDYNQCDRELHDYINAGFVAKNKNTPTINKIFDAMVFELTRPVYAVSPDIKPETYNKNGIRYSV